MSQKQTATHVDVCYLIWYLVYDGHWLPPGIHGVILKGVGT